MPSDSNQLQRRKTVNLYLLRHGEVSGPPALYGHTDITLSKDGLASMEQCTKSLQVNKIISSPLLRCAQFSEAFSRRRQLSLSYKNSLQECDFGTFDGAAFESLNEQEWQTLSLFWQAPAKHTLPGAEALNYMLERVTSAWQTIVSATQDDTLIVTHGGVIRLILASTLDMDWRNPSLYSKLSIAHSSLTKIKVFLESGRPTQVSYIGCSGVSNED